jgi:hypothetical protein
MEVLPIFVVEGWKSIVYSTLSSAIIAAKKLRNVPDQLKYTLLIMENAEMPKLEIIEHQKQIGELVSFQ